MGARPDQALALALLTAIHDLWREHPETVVVRASNIALASLEQICVKAIATDLRTWIDDQSKSGQVTQDDRDLVVGELRWRDGRTKGLTLRDALNKITHGTPSEVEFRDDSISLRFANAETNSTGGHDWDEAHFSATDALQHLKRLSRLNPQEERDATRQAQRLVQLLGTSVPEPKTHEDQP